LLRSGIDFDLKNKKTVDVQTIFHKMEQRTLSAAYTFYCNKTLDNAHTAAADTKATYEVLKAQLDRYDELENNIDVLSVFSTRRKSADLAGYLQYNKDGVVCFGFGKHKGKTVDEVLDKEPGYFGWLLNADFPLYTKKVLTALRLQKMNNKLN
jgi:DNA polymerase-3 subunit epsilon